MRPYQEDRFFSLTCEKGLCFGVFDGHGGEECSEYLAENFAEALTVAFEDKTHYLFDGTDIELRLDLAFHKLNIATQFMDCGSTASVAFMPWDGKSVTVAVVGDSPVIVRKADGKIWVAPEHNVRTNAAEAAAAQSRGGFIQRGYLFQSWNGICLQMARAFGDADLSRVLSRKPDIETIKLANKSWVLVATDGALDPAHSDPEAATTAVAKLVNEGADAQAIVDRALKIPTHDNVTALLVRINKSK